YFVTDPQRFDVIVTDNLFGDILTDLGAAIAGGIGLAASGNINPARTTPSMFEPVHGSAPDIAGKAIADPTATVLSVAMLLDHLGLTEAASVVEAAVAADLSARATAPDSASGRATTSDSASGRATTPDSASGRVPGPVRRATHEVGDALAARVAG
ncbi:MAG: 3-isopropylmalate dehydrogenase, partial [Actinomycetota bacterium]|nr:3-isopropylmalate dehydrogenase [Actinomycetota bacterium]